jgi:hypothetical protein
VVRGERRGLPALLAARHGGIPEPGPGRHDEAALLLIHSRHHRRQIRFSRARAALFVGTGGFAHPGQSGPAVRRQYGHCGAKARPSILTDTTPESVFHGSPAPRGYGRLTG